MIEIDTLFVCYFEHSKSQSWHSMVSTASIYFHRPERLYQSLPNRCLRRENNPMDAGTKQYQHLEKEPGKSGEKGIR